MVFKKNYIKLILSFVIGILAAFFTFGYSVLNEDIDINGTANVPKATYDVHFANVHDEKGKTPTEAPTITNGTSICFGAPLKKPGDYYEFTVDIVNAGTLDAMLDSIELPELTEEQQKYLEFEIEYISDGSCLAPIELKDAINGGNSESITIRIEYKDNVATEDMPEHIESINLSFKLKYVVKSDTAHEINYTCR